MKAGRVHIHYRRLPDDLQVFVQDLLLDDPEVKVSFQPDTPVREPVVIEERTILEPGSPVVWFTFPGRWHDIGRFHTGDGTFTGFYANVLTPPSLDGHTDEGTPRWDTTDLFLDVWVGLDGRMRVLDRDQLDQALANRWLDPATAARAEAEVRSIRAAHARGEWPPPVVEEWTLDRARRALD